MATKDFIATYSDEYVTITIKRKTADRMAAVLSDVGDWIDAGNVEDSGLTVRQMIAACADAEHLVTLLCQSGAENAKP